jgi:hypothetical protein
MSRIDSADEPISQMMTSHVIASPACVARAVVGKDSKGVEPLCVPTLGRTAMVSGIIILAGTCPGGWFVMRVTTGATIIAANAAQQKKYLILALSGRLNSVRTTR